MWDLATCAGGEPNVVPAAFKDVVKDGKLVIGDVFLETTLKNIQANRGKDHICARIFRRIAIMTYKERQRRRLIPQSV